MLTAVLVLSGCDAKNDKHSAVPVAPLTTPGAQPAQPPPPVPTETQPSTPSAPPGEDPAIPAPLRLPKRVPRQATTKALVADAGVVRRWSAALRHGHVQRAADLFAQPSKVQNGTPVITLKSRLERLAFNASLSCGAQPTRFGGARGFTIVTFRLTERVGGDCHGAAGNIARCAIRVRNGRIAEWYRLADPASPAPPDGGLPTGVAAA
jgi:hypothetical protein